MIYKSCKFNGCPALSSVEFGNSLTRIDSFVFSGSGLKSIEIPTSVKSIGDHAFADCAWLEQIVISSFVESIGDYAFSGCDSLSCVEIPNSVISLGRGVFERCMSLDCVVIPNSVTSIGNSVFTSCWLNEIHWTPNANIIDGYESGLCGSYTLPILYLYRNSENAGILDDVISSLEGEFKEIIVVDGSYSSSVKRVEEEIAHKESIIYDLQGRQVEHPSRGIYIVNGVKRYMK